MEVRNQRNELKKIRAWSNWEIARRFFRRGYPRQGFPGGDTNSNNDCNNLNNCNNVTVRKKDDLFIELFEFDEDVLFVKVFNGPITSSSEPIYKIKVSKPEIINMSDPSESIANEFNLAIRLKIERRGGGKGIVDPERNVVIDDSPDP